MEKGEEFDFYVNCTDLDHYIQVRCQKKFNSTLL